MKRKYTSNARRRSKRDVTTNYIKIFAVALVILLFFGVIAYSACTPDDEPQTQPLQNDLTELTQVITTDTPDGVLLHYPGFDVYFSKEHHQPYYSVWLLSPDQLREATVPRSERFRPDPDVPESAQLADYKYSGYDRGHMAPSADFRHDLEQQEATFFLTNMCPQLGSLNSGAWNRLEDQCRKWALKDSTLVIISGPVLTDRLTESIGDSHVTVPARFFKVVYAPFANPPRAIGFIMPNGYVEGGVQQSVVTVDEVEAITGFDFFSALPDSLENIVESQSKYHIWQRK